MSEKVPAPGLVGAEAMAQRCVATAMALNRAMVPANARVKSFNFDIDGLVGFDMQSVTVGVIGDTEAATASANLFRAFSKASGNGTVLTANESSDEATAVYAKADILTVFSSKVVVDSVALAAMKPTAMVIAPFSTCNMGRVLEALETKKLGYFGCLDTPDITAEASAKFAQVHNLASARARILLM